VFEYELPLIKLGEPAEIGFPYGQSTRNLKGKITFVYPDVDPQTRRVKVRIEFRNPGFELKPDTFVTVSIRAGAGEQLAVSKEAVIDTGTQRYALVALDGGYFEPREIEVATPVDQFYPVLKGLSHGDRVVTSAQFLIDSETNLQSAIQSMIGHGDMKGMEMPPASPGAPAGGPPPDHSRHQ